MSLHELILWQSRYVFVAVLFNLVSLTYEHYFGQGFTSTNPKIGIAIMLLYAIFLESGKRGYETLYRCLMLVSVIILGYGGIIQHFINSIERPWLYLNIWVAMLAILINLIGSVLNLYAVSGRYHK